MRQKENSMQISELSFGKVIVRFLRRRKYLVNQKLQYHLLLTSLFYVLFFASCMAVSLFLPLIIQLRSLDPASAEASQTALEFLSLHAKFWPTMLLTFLVIALHSIYTSHKIAGPLYRFNLIFNAVKQGWLPRSVKLRKGDHLKAEMGQINDMLMSLRSKIEEIRHAQSDLCAAVILCKQEIGGDLSEEKRELLNDLLTKGDLLECKVAQFNIEA